MTSTLSALPEVVSETDVAIETRKEQLRSRKLRKRRQFDPSYESATDRVYSGDLSPEKDPRPVLYCAENDHESVARLKRELRTRVRVVDCMVDRVCTGRRIGPQGVEIDAEPWPGSIVVLEPGFDPRYVPFAPSVATLPESLRHADYLSERKFSLVNGMHTALTQRLFPNVSELQLWEDGVAAMPRLSRRRGRPRVYASIVGRHRSWRS